MFSVLQNKELSIVVPQLDTISAVFVVNVVISISRSAFMLPNMSDMYSALSKFHDDKSSFSNAVAQNVQENCLTFCVVHLSLN